MVAYGVHARQLDMFGSVVPTRAGLKVTLSSSLEPHGRISHVVQCFDNYFHHQTLAKSPHLRQNCLLIQLNHWPLEKVYRVSLLILIG